MERKNGKMKRDVINRESIEYRELFKTVKKTS